MYLLQKPHKWVLELSEQDSFFWDNRIWGVTWLGFPQKMNIFPSISFETPHKCVLKPSE